MLAATWPISREEKRSASRSPARWPTRRWSCCSTSPRPRSMKPPSWRLNLPFKTSCVTRDSPAYSLLMTPLRQRVWPSGHYCSRPDASCALALLKRCCMLKFVFNNQLYLVLAQAFVAALAALLVVLLARKRGIHLESETLIALLRGIIQIIAVGSVLMLLLRGPRWTSGFLLAGMIVAAGATSARRAKGMPDAFRVSASSIAFGAGSVIALMTWLGVIDTAITSLVPVGSMLIANAMNTNGLALNRFRADVLAHVGEIETALALGAEAKNSVGPYVQASFEASLIPAIDSLRSLGIVWIPGLMAGMLLSGARPVYAAIYQFVVLAMIFASSGLTSLVSTLLMRTRVMSPAEQLVLRPEN